MPAKTAPHLATMSRRLLGGLVCACSALAASLLLCGASPARASDVPTSAPASQRLAVLLSSHEAFIRPDSGSKRLTMLDELRPITGERTVLPVIGGAIGSDGVPWLDVMLPGRPNGSSGWIAEKGTRESLTEWYLAVDLGSRQVRVYHDARLLRTFAAVVGKPSTPTPIGAFFVEETLKMRGDEPGGPFALALSARSNVFSEFDGGPGQIAVHGRDGLGGTLGSAASHGCVRLSTSSIEWLAKRIGPGVPVGIFS